jgi:hypothetical protein
VLGAHGHLAGGGTDAARLPDDSMQGDDGARENAIRRFPSAVMMFTGAPHSMKMAIWLRRGAMIWEACGTLP